MSKKEKKKASDVFRESKPALGKAPFKEAFPELKTVKVHVEEDGKDGTGKYSEKPMIGIYDENNLGEFIDCSNRLCYNGGFSIGKILREMIEKKETHHESLEFCQGWQGTKRKRGLSCPNKFKVTVDMEYYSEELKNKSESSN